MRLQCRDARRLFDQPANHVIGVVEIFRVEIGAKFAPGFREWEEARRRRDGFPETRAIPLPAGPSPRRARETPKTGSPVQRRELRIRRAIDKADFADVRPDGGELLHDIAGAPADFAGDHEMGASASGIVRSSRRQTRSMASKFFPGSTVPTIST